MRGIKIIPLFLFLVILSYMGVRFVLANPDVVKVRFAGYETGDMAVGLIVLTSILVGMVISGTLASVEMLSLYFQNKTLRRKLHFLQPQLKAAKQQAQAQDKKPSELASHSVSGEV